MALAGAEARMERLLALMPDLLSATRPPAQMLQRAAEVARDVMGACYTTAALLSGDGSLSTVAHAGLKESEIDRIGAFPVDEGIVRDLRDSAGPILVNHAPGSDPVSLRLPRGYPGARTVLGVHLRAGHQVIGIMLLTDRADGDAFDDADVDVAEGLGGALGTAIGNAHLLRDALLARQWLRAATGLTREIFASELDDSLRLISDRASELAGADVVTVSLVEGDLMTLRHAQGRPPAPDLVGFTFPLERVGSMRRVVTSGRAEIADPDAPDALHLPGVRTGSGMLLPLHGVDSVVGVLHLSRRPGAAAFTASDLEIAGSFANHVAVTLQLAAARETEERLKVVEDRDRIARDLHDSVVQRLFATGLTLQQAASSAESGVGERIAVAVQHLDETIREIRNAILTLRSAAAETAPLGTWLSTIADDATPLLGFKPQLALESPAREVSGPLATDLAACLREGLSNVVRHAHASEVEINGRVDTDQLVLTLRDNGIGVQSDRRSGLGNLEARMRAHGGSFEVAQPSDGGTLLTWRAPLPRQRGFA